MISPVFEPRVTEYVLWLPYEVTSVEVVGIPKDDRAAVTVEGNSRLRAGRDNPITVTCTAEDGSEKVYTIVAKRAEEYVPVTTQITAATDEPAGGGETLPQTDAQEKNVDIPSWSYIVVAVAGITGSAAVGILISERKK